MKYHSGMTAVLHLHMATKYTAEIQIFKTLFCTPTEYFKCIKGKFWSKTFHAKSMTRYFYERLQQSQLSLHEMKFACLSRRFNLGLLYPFIIRESPI